MAQPAPSASVLDVIDSAGRDGDGPAMVMTVTDIYRFPMKGLSAERLDEASLLAGETLNADRRFAVALGSTPVEGAYSEWKPKTSFLALVRNEKLATLETKFDDASETLTVLRNGRQVSRGKLTDGVGRGMLEEFFKAYMGDEARGRPRIVEAADGHVLSDVPDKVVSIISKASVRDLERVTGKPVDPLRFRGNIVVEADEPWTEFQWIGRNIVIGGATLRVIDRIERCAATNVDPTTAARDMNIPLTLQRGFAHTDMGIYARVISDGTVTTGDTVTPVDD